MWEGFGGLAELPLVKLCGQLVKSESGSGRERGTWTLFGYRKLSFANITHTPRCTLQFVALCSSR